MGRSFSRFCVTYTYKMSDSVLYILADVTHSPEQADCDRLQIPCDGVVHGFCAELSRLSESVDLARSNMLTKKSAIAHEITGQQSFNCHTSTPAV